MFEITAGPEALNFWPGPLIFQKDSLYWALFHISYWPQMSQGPVTFWTLFQTLRHGSTFSCYQLVIIVSTLLDNCDIEQRRLWHLFNCFPTMSLSKGIHVYHVANSHPRCVMNSTLKHCGRWENASKVVWTPGVWSCHKVRMLVTLDHKKIAAKVS